MKENKLLIKKAKELLKKPKKLTTECIVSEVGSALFTDKGNVYLGVSIDGGSLTFCAEQSAILNMITNGESKIKTIVAVDSEGKILPPCGVCREIMYQVDKGNKNTQIIIGENKIITLDELLKHRWQDI